MMVPGEQFNRLFGAHAARMREICRQIDALDCVERVILFGSYAKGCPTSESDIDLAVFFQGGETSLVERYRQLARICANTEIDVQVQPFDACELNQPCGIVEEIVRYGVELCNHV